MNDMNLYRWGFLGVHGLCLGVTLYSAVAFSSIGNAAAAGLNFAAIGFWLMEPRSRPAADGGAKL